MPRTSGPSNNMLTADPPADVHRELHAIERQIADATAQHREHLARLEGQQDGLLLRLTDLDGCHDRHFVPVR